MIEILSSSSRSSPSTASPQTIVTGALTAIVEHYRDPVYNIPEAPPSFDGALRVPAVLQHWLDRIEKSSEEVSGIHGVSACLANGYMEKIRPAIFCRESAYTLAPSLSRPGIPVLQHYEIFLSQFLERNPQLKQTENNGNTQLLNVQTYTGSSSDGPFSLEVLASDISVLTKLAVHLREKERDADTSKNNISAFTVTNIVLPTMIRLLMHHISLSERADPERFVSAQSSLRKCAVVLLAFGKPKIDPRDIINHVTDTMTMLHPDRSFLYTPLIHHVPYVDLADTASLNVARHLTEESFWNSVQLNDGSCWNDPQTGAVASVVEKCWRHLYKTVRHLDSRKAGMPQRLAKIPLISVTASPNEEDMRDNSINGEAEVPNFDTLDPVIRGCLSLLSADNSADGGVAKAVRAHFFGRDIISSENRLSTTSTKATRLHLGWEIEVEDESPDKALEKAFLEIPSRVHVALHYIRLLERRDLLQGQNNDGSNAILDEILPVIYDLISAHGSAHIALGSAALIHLLLLTIHPSTNVVENVNNTCISCDFIFAKYTGSLLPVLDMACKTCRKGAPLFFLARAQSLLCMLASASPNSQDSLAIHRRKTTREFLVVLDRNNHKVTDPEGVIWSLLVGGVLPLLYQHASGSDAFHNVDGMELGRAGLSALLPILRYSAGWSDDKVVDEESLEVFDPSQTAGKHSRKLLGPSVVTLVHLLYAAYPIMPRHGGKIMSELLALLGNLQRQTLPESGIALVGLVQDAAAIALVICGDRASKILDVVTANEGTDFEPGLVQMVDVIRRKAEARKKGLLPK